MLGQLGTADGLGDRNHTADSFADAGFSGTASGVFCIGNTSYVIDGDGSLWAAGENRYGQMGNAYGLLSSAAGWISVSGGEDTVCVSGETGAVYFLKTDGTLYQAGANAAQVLTACAGLPKVSKISASDGYIYALGTNGVLYRKECALPDAWERLTSSTVRITDFAACGTSYAWTDTSGRFMSMGIYYPGSWEYTSSGYVLPDTRIASMETNGSLLIYTDLKGVLYTSDSNETKPVDMDSALLNLYSDNGNVYAVYENGSVLVWKRYEAQYAMLAESIG